MHWILTACVDIFMVVGPSLCYIDQYRAILKQRSSDGFSSKVCLILIVANLLRVFFWLGKHFDPILLYQSLLMLLTQFILLHAVIKFRPMPLLESPVSTPPLSPVLPQRSTSDGYVQLEGGKVKVQREWGFWRYMLAITLFTAVMSALHALNTVWSSSLYVEALGASALGIEACLGIPQVISNFQRKSTEGFSIVVLSTWVIGDVFKSGYFILTKSPMQFTVCGLTQVCVDFIIVGQSLWYRRGYVATTTTTPIVD